MRKLSLHAQRAWTFSGLALAVTAFGNDGSPLWMALYVTAAAACAIVSFIEGLVLTTNWNGGRRRLRAWQRLEQRKRGRVFARLCPSDDRTFRAVGWLLLVFGAGQAGFLAFLTVS